RDGARSRRRPTQRASAAADAPWRDRRRLAALADARARGSLPASTIRLRQSPRSSPTRTMKLATYKDGSRDGQLVVVSRNLATAHYATGIATRLQQLLDDWNFLSPQLEDLATTLNHGKARHAFDFDPAMCMAPLPRAFQWAD